MRSIAEWCQYCNDIAVSKGWDFEEKDIPEKIALMHAELSEALEEYRRDRMMTWTGEDGKPEGFAVELADLMIRLFHLAGKLKIDLEGVMAMKMMYNENRAFRHGGLKA